MAATQRVNRKKRKSNDLLFAQEIINEALKTRLIIKKFFALWTLVLKLSLPADNWIIPEVSK